jgi:biotin operon repressor
MIHAIRDLRGVTATEKLVLYALAAHLPRVFPSQSLLAAETGLGRQAVNATIQKLVARGLLIVTARAAGQGNEYAFSPAMTAGDPVVLDDTPCRPGRHPLSLTTTPPVVQDDTKKQTKIQTKKQTKTLSSFHDDIEPAFDSWNAMAERAGLPTVQLRSDARKKALSARLKDAGGLEGWLAALDKVEASPFLRGERGSWKANFEFVSKAANFAKIMEGNYDDKRGPNAGREPTDGVAVGSAMRAFMAVMRGPGDRDPQPDWPGRPDGAGRHEGHDRPGGGSGGAAPGGGRGLPTSEPGEQIVMAEPDEPEFLRALENLTQALRHGVGETPTHYHTTSIRPAWSDAESMRFITTIGRHRFYEET